MSGAAPTRRPPAERTISSDTGRVWERRSRSVMATEPTNTADRRTNFRTLETPKRVHHDAAARPTGLHLRAAEPARLRTGRSWVGAVTIGRAYGLRAAPLATRHRSSRRGVHERARVLTRMLCAVFVAIAAAIAAAAFASAARTSSVQPVLQHATDKTRRRLAPRAVAVGAAPTNRSCTRRPLSHREGKYEREESQC
jgi:hypothetical protein